MRNTFQTKRYDVSNAKITIVGSSTNISNSTHGILYVADGYDIITGKLKFKTVLKCPGYCMIRDDYLKDTYENKNDVWRDMVASRMMAYGQGTGQTDKRIVGEIIVVPRGALGEPLVGDKGEPAIIDTYVHKRLNGKVATNLGQDLMDLDFEDKLKNIDLNDRRKVFEYAKNLILDEYKEKTNKIELDLAQALQIAEFEKALELFIRDPRNFGPFKALFFDAPRTGKTLIALYLAILKKYGFKTVVIANWVLTGTYSFDKEKNQWAGFDTNTVNFMDKKHIQIDLSKEIQWVNVSLHYPLDKFKQTYGFLKSCPGDALVIADEIDDGSWNKNQTEKFDWLLSNVGNMKEVA